LAESDVSFLVIIMKLLKSTWFEMIIY